MTDAKDPNTLLTFDDRLAVLRSRWAQYRAGGAFDIFVEFTVALSSMTEHLSRFRLPGLVRLCEGLENIAIAKISEPGQHPLPDSDCDAIERQIDTLLAAIETARKPASAAPQRRTEPTSGKTKTAGSEWVKPRSVWIIVAEERNEQATGLAQQLNFFGFRADTWRWDGVINATSQPLAVIFISKDGEISPGAIQRIQRVRKACPASQLFYFGAPRALEPIVNLMRAGIDVTIPAEEQTAMVLNRILDLLQIFEQEKCRVLVVEDSRVASMAIRRALADHGIGSQGLTDPGQILAAVEEYQPDLILMDMYMPRFNGIEATRALRQLAACQTLPIVYLSGESDAALQVEALRLGGDQFLTKPFNPVLLAAVVQTTVERYRSAQRSSHLDGLTGLLNHTAAKARLEQLLSMARNAGEKLAVVMLDIDHFKAINDTYGHPVGDQVIRGLAWLLKGRLRATDLIGRYGGEEFLLALPGAEPDQVKDVIDRIRMSFETLPHSHANGILHARFSAGIAGYPQFSSAADLITAADGALLEAKHLGRNRIELARKVAF